MRKALVFISAFALVLVAGAAVAFMSAPGNDTAHSPEAINEPIESSDTFPEKEEPAKDQPFEEPKDEKPQAEEPKDEKHEEEAPKEEPKDEEPKEEEDTDPPDLIITFPENGQHFSEKRIAFEGKTEPGARVLAGEYEADVDAEGHWRIILILTNKGGNLATFKAIDAAGNYSTASVKAYYDPPTEEKDPPKDFEFWAKQKYGSCGENPPYDKFYGMGEPGTKILITSEFGSADTTIGESGEWWLKVFFEEAPCNEAFLVTLTTDAGHEKHFEFIRLCEEGGGEGK